MVPFVGMGISLIFQKNFVRLKNPAIIASRFLEKEIK